jgi:hypothetical protein
MIEEHLSAIKDVHIFPIISLLLFMIFFIVMGIWVYRIKGDYIEKMGQLPLQNGNEDIINEGTKDYES